MPRLRKDGGKQIATNEQPKQIAMQPSREGGVRADETTVPIVVATVSRHHWEKNNNTRGGVRKNQRYL